MKTVAIYNMKGGVGKTTTAVNLSYCAAAAGKRTLLWDLDPQAASSFAFRVRPHVSGFGKKSLENGHALDAAIKETDYTNLCLLPADFAYRKFERFLNSLGKPERLLITLLDTLGRNFDVVFLDCPAGFSLLTEGVFAAADAVLVPTVPTVLSLRTVARVIKWAGRSETPTRLAPFFSMVDRRKVLHRRACEWSAAHPEMFLSAQIPYASVVEQMAVRRMPLAAFAPREAATSAFAEVWSELQTCLHKHRETSLDHAARLQAIDSLILQLESTDRPASLPSRPTSVKRGNSSIVATPAAEESSFDGGDVSFVHSFDTEQRDLERCGYVLELRERKRGLLIVAAKSGSDAVADITAGAQIDGSWALQILSGEMSPLTALDRRLGRPGPRAVENIRAIVGGRSVRRMDARVVSRCGTDRRESLDDYRATSYSDVIRAH